MSGALRGLILAAPASGQGKTTVALALMRALARRGAKLAPFKVGPDYIDPQFHALAAGRESINLDPWAMRAATRAALLRAAANDGAEIALIEGVMGLFDGIDAEGSASTAALACELDLPVVLVVDARGMAASIAPLVAGFARHRAGLRVAGVILNRIGSAAHVATLRAALARSVPEIRVLGALPRAESIVLGSRHLGLVPAGEVAAEETIAAAAALAEANIDLDAVLAMARPPRSIEETTDVAPLLAPLGQRIAIARDDAFVFAYPAQLAAWRRAGAELSFFSPLADEAPAGGSDAVFLPGGYPELHAGRLAAASRFKAGMRMAAARGASVYGECGGYMTLGAGLVDAERRRHAMLEMLPLETSFAARRLHLGYRAARLLADGRLGAGGALLAGHEFHYATILDEGHGPALFDCAAADGSPLGPAGRVRGNVAGSFVHLVDRRDAPPATASATPA